MSKTVFLNPGHGGSDPGAVANGFKEKDLNLTIALACRDDLKRHGVAVVMGRDKDVDRTSGEIISICNASGAELAVDIHNNAGGGDGAEVYYYSGGGESLELANSVLSEIVKLGQNSRGVKTKLSDNGTDYYYFVRDTNPPAVIVECAFVDNRTDMKIIDTTAEQKAMGVAIAKGVLKILGITYKAEVKENKEEVTSESFETAGVQALLMTANRLGIISQTISPLDNKCGKMTKAAILQMKKHLKMKEDYTVDLTFISKTYQALIDALPVVGDINADGKVNIKDATALQKQIAGIE